MTEPAQSWFEPGLDTATGSVLTDEFAEGFASHGDARTLDGGDEVQFFVQQADRLAGASGSAFARLHRAFLAARAALGTALVAAQCMAGLLGAAAPFWTVSL